MDTAQFQTIEGKVAMLFSAPHAYSHRRPSLNGCYKLGEPYTDEIVKKVCNENSCFGIYLNRECDYDPNYQKISRNEYKKTVKDIIVKNNLQRFVDIHGLKDNQDYDIALYYQTRFSKSLAFAYEIEDMLNNGELRGVNIRVFRFLDNGQETLGEYVASKLRVPAVQIEVARYIRNDMVLRNCFIKNLGELSKNYI